MIRINLLGVERQTAKKAPAFDPSRYATALCVAVLALGAGGVGWWYWTLGQASARVDAELAAAELEVAQLRSLLTEVQAFEAQRAQLQRRVGLIEQLRGGQSVPARLLDHVSRSVPDMLWLTDMAQQGSTVTIEGRTTTIISVSDFVANLGNGSMLRKPIELVNSQVESAGGGAPGQTSTELIRFTIKAEMAPAGAGPGQPAAAAAGE